MKIQLLVACGALLFFGCGGGRHEGAVRLEQDGAARTDELPRLVSPPLRKPDCGGAPPHAELWFSDAGLLIRLVPAGTGEQLEVRDTACRVLRRLSLAAGRAADYPRYLADVSYNQASKWVVVRDFDRIWCYDLLRDTLFPPLRPQFRLPRPRVDAQSGRILRLEQWEYYLVGWAQDLGAFAFDLSQAAPRPVWPVAEYRLSDELIRSLFLLPVDEAGNRQAIVPWYDYEGAAFHVNPLFERPLALQLPADGAMPGSRYVPLVARDTSGEMRTFVVDMARGMLATAPAVE